MPDQNADRRAELIAAALVGELTEAEAAEFERMRASDPTIDAELVQLQGLTGNISGLPDWMEASPSEELRERVLGIAAADRGGSGASGAGTGTGAGAGASGAHESGTDESGTDEPGAHESGTDEARTADASAVGTPVGSGPSEATRRGREAGAGTVSDPEDTRIPGQQDARITPLRRSRFGGGLLLGVAAAGLVIGAVGDFHLPRADTPPPVGGPGTLGAVEAVNFQGEPSGVEIDGSVVAHTWGTETLLTVTGLPSGEFYSVVVDDEAGEEVGSGTFLGSEVEINCAVNAAALREEVTSVEIRAESGDVVASAALPRVEG
ncbi:hypothetical protein [Pseudoclavibacter helvolus]|uniref:Anti-sigma factor n=1 Tax=Pseudoclavibacter helvolus TaxID=255205 RepID=A0A7W4YFZ2_9MICO|nr:hypothetical protein [Pseudoclavibacter helvolus]MBB2957496.1 hypothetical protein [Pseudoclavibacter helvolus]